MKRIIGASTDSVVRFLNNGTLSHSVRCATGAHNFGAVSVSIAMVDVYGTSEVSCLGDLLHRFCIVDHAQKYVCETNVRHSIRATVPHTHTCRTVMCTACYGCVCEWVLNNVKITMHKGRIGVRVRVWLHTCIRGGDETVCMADRATITTRGNEGYTTGAVKTNDTFPHRYRVCCCCCVFLKNSNLYIIIQSEGTKVESGSPNE